VSIAVLQHELQSTRLELEAQRRRQGMVGGGDDHRVVVDAVFCLLSLC
jgi:hypothetical protein